MSLSPTDEMILVVILGPEEGETERAKAEIERKKINKYETSKTLIKKISAMNEMLFTCCRLESEFLM